MPTIQEFTVKSPNLMIDTFYIEIPAGENWQKMRGPDL